MLKDDVRFSAAPCFVYVQNSKVPLPPFGSVLPLGASFSPVTRLDSFRDIASPCPPFWFRLLIWSLCSEKSEERVRVIVSPKGELPESWPTHSWWVSEPSKSPNRSCFIWGV